ncbi:hypothetical protein Ahy_B09g098482 [Arachis hypogaea]|uniref:Protein FAR1-RELATED SEQUENCE n=1 Tax=Arachis hypogaea TaxID=3818 RepID=A0A444XRF2_ARAHY|nr:hypothetical protein Ahy_B09g098482 [Arachis hypogaea]
MQQQNRNFFYEVKLDEQHRIEHVFWANARSHATYEHFGDVMSFDTTYLTNRYDMPFASFVGVNHHGQSLLLGCAILSCEEESYFLWLFDCWIRCIGDKPSIGILTDQCKAMRNAIKKSLPMTQHRWCIWHILKKISEKLGAYKQSNEISADMRYIVWESRSKKAFESCWTNFINRFSLHDNNWLAGLYEECDKWVPIFLSNNFWASMSSTQRSESIQRESYAVILFQSFGLERVKKFLNKYILDRWKKTLKRKHNSIKCSHDPCRLEPVKKCYDEICKQFYNIAEVAVASEELTETVHRIIDSV